jgi:hypothetical protein
VPAKPAWISKIDEVIRQLEALPRPFIDRASIEFLLGVGRRRAQQILAPCITDRVGSNGLADRAVVSAHLRRLANEGEGYYEKRRRQKVATALERFRQERLSRPQLLVEAPVTIAGQQLQNLPAGVRLEAGRITIEFDQPRQALEKLLALAMAIGNDFGGFEKAATCQPSPPCA